MIRVTSKISTAPIDALSGFLDSQNQIVGGITAFIYDTYSPELLRALQEQPPPAKKPIEWTSAKQRRYVMAKLREENNLPYQRTGKLAASWQVQTVSSGGTFQIIVRNDAPPAKYVYGTLARNFDMALRFKQRFHTNTGWIDAGEITWFWLLEMEKQFLKEYNDMIGEFGITQSYTRAYTKG